MNVGIIGQGAIAGFLRNHLVASRHSIRAVLLRPTREPVNPEDRHVSSVADLPDTLDVMIDCAGHGALISYGPEILRRGIDLITVSLGALADPRVHDTLREAALQGGARLHLASGAIGALDCLQAARCGRLDTVTYVGRKPPAGWRGSPAEKVLDLDTLTVGSAEHFEGTARDAAIAYPKNANVAAAVALAGIGFEQTRVKLIADADIADNIHEIQATGAFGSFHFRINGRSLPDNPRSSALAAMSVVSKLEQISDPIRL